MTAPAKPARKRGPSNPVDSPWRNGGPEESRHTVARKLRLRPPEDTALVALAGRHELDLARMVGALALAEAEGVALATMIERARAGEQDSDAAPADGG